MFTCKTTNMHEDFCALTHALDLELNRRYGKEQALYDKHNVLDPIETALIGYEDNLPVACGCFKKIDDTTVEIKRMFVQPNYRRRGLSSRLLLELHAWAEECGFLYAQLETGKGQPEAIALYTKMGYAVIPNYAPYVGMENSVCMRKVLRS
ncbi:GCN5-related N-acetyltransferase [Sulfurospirillum diekertiae]|uniref:GCN5-related N-acetyltransferase n=1 Tax=Sulfurospirillum diekertiae TaxID=1854492 RepID=A0A290HT91_9BACT|nr:GNAT family N-acetyltransferase [Sulfurospirillum diekertiae]ATB70918.1 GCN5-related N-acetyltransferase [Sulfurospirillum diekertiae]